MIFPNIPDVIFRYIPGYPQHCVSSDKEVWRFYGESWQKILPHKSKITGEKVVTLIGNGTAEIKSMDQLFTEFEGVNELDYRQRQDESQ